MKTKELLRTMSGAAAILAITTMLTACGGGGDETAEPTTSITLAPTIQPDGTPLASGGPTETPVTAEPTPSATTKPEPTQAPASTTKPVTKPSASPEAIEVAAQPDSITVMVNKQIRLPDNYKPEDLVEADVHFIFKEKNERRLMRKEAAEALKQLFDKAAEEGVPLAAVSGYRSQGTQKSLYQNYVNRDGEEAANKYSAKPGHSEHQTGLAMDVTSKDGKCAAQDCFGSTKEAKWLAEHAHEFGFIIRYLKGKENITGYQYEPWHLRYVGVETATEIYEKGLTLEEYYNEAVPVSQ